MHLPVDLFYIKLKNYKETQEFALSLDENDNLRKYRNQFLVVLQERLINQKTLKQCAEILNKSQERTRQIEAKLIRILRTKMKGYK